MSRKYYRIMLGRLSVHAPACFAGNFIGADDYTGDLTGHLPDDWREFNAWFIPQFLQRLPEKSRIAAGLAGGFLWGVTKGLHNGDIVICPDGNGTYWAGEIIGDYQWVAEGVPPHRRPVRWFEHKFDRASMSEDLKNATGFTGPSSEITRFSEEIDRLIGAAPSGPRIVVADESVEDPVAFAMEKHLEDFLVQNWASTELGRDFDIYSEEGERIGQQYATDTGPMDILAISKDKTQLLVVELKRGRASDVVVGQVLRYMGFVMQELAEPHQSVRGAIIALDGDQRTRRALAAVPNVDFYRYQVSFKLIRS